MLCSTPQQLGRSPAAAAPELGFQPFRTKQRDYQPDPAAGAGAVCEALMALQAESEAAKAAAAAPHAANKFMRHAANELDGETSPNAAATMLWASRVSAVGMQRVAVAANAAAPCIGVPMRRPGPLHRPRPDTYRRGRRRLPDPAAAQIDTSMYRLSALALPASTHLLTYRASALLKAAAAHRTFVEHCLGDQQQLAEMMDQQMTGEEAIEVAISLGMPRPSTAGGH